MDCWTCRNRPVHPWISRTALSAARTAFRRVYISPDLSRSNETGKRRCEPRHPPLPSRPSPKLSSPRTIWATKSRSCEEALRNLLPRCWTTRPKASRLRTGQIGRDAKVSATSSLLGLVARRGQPARAVQFRVRLAAWVGNGEARSDVGCRSAVVQERRLEHFNHAGPCSPSRQIRIRFARAASDRFHPFWCRIE